jgi:SagB-type dehydrogenase family enzyme
MDAPRIPTLNRQTDRARRYHDATKHSYWSIRLSTHYLDWENQPFPFKVYRDLEAVVLPRDVRPTGVSALDALAAEADEGHLSSIGSRESCPDLTTLAHVLFYSAGVTKKKTYPGGEIYFRAAACAGALYPIEIYLVCGDLPGLDAGVYHFSPLDFALRKLRAGDYRPVLVEATAHEAAVAHAPVTIVLTALTWRSAWKYRDRSYRYHYWDAGMILAHLGVTAGAHRLPYRLVMGFVDATVNHLLGIDGEQEMALALLPVGWTSARVRASGGGTVADISPTVMPLSREQVDYPLIREMHAASSLCSAEEVEAWREGDVPPPTAEPRHCLISLHRLDRSGLRTEDLESVIMRRASTRRFAHKAITFDDLSTILALSTVPLPSDFFPSPAWVTDLYVSVHAVETIRPGTYYFHRDRRALETLREGDFRRRARDVCLEQDLGGDASATIFFLADLSRVLDRFGNRGYRIAQLEAGLIGGRMYLASYALGRGATGLTFYDDDVIEFFSPHAAGKSAIFVLAVGVPGRLLLR